MIGIVLPYYNHLESLNKLLHSLESANYEASPDIGVIDEDLGGLGNPIFKPHSEVSLHKVITHAASLPQQGEKTTSGQLITCSGRA